MHARSGGQYEIMGLMQGKLDGDTMVVMDAFALPVIGTETRVNAQNDANEFMIQVRLMDYDTSCEVHADFARMCDSSTSRVLLQYVSFFSALIWNQGWIMPGMGREYPQG